jgi:hypothetical protein
MIRNYAVGSRLCMVTNSVSGQSLHLVLFSQREPSAAGERGGPPYAASPEADPGRLRPGPCARWCVGWLF